MCWVVLKFRAMVYSSVEPSSVTTWVHVSCAVVTQSMHRYALDSSQLAPGPYARSSVQRVASVIVNNVFAILGLAGVLNAQKELVTAFFAYNAVQTVISFHMFVDVCITARIVFPSETATAGLSTYEKGAAAFVFFNFLLSTAATVFAVKAVDEIRTKQREDFTSISVLSGDL